MSFMIRWLTGRLAFVDRPGKARTPITEGDEVPLCPSNAGQIQTIIKKNTTMLRKQIKYLMVYSLLTLPCVMQAQDDVTNAFDDLKTTGYGERAGLGNAPCGSSDAVKKLIQENPEAGYFCFTEDREHDIRMTDAIPLRWVERSADSRTKFQGDCLPGEFYTWQVGIFAPYETLSNLSVTFL